MLLLSGQCTHPRGDRELRQDRFNPVRAGRGSLRIVSGLAENTNSIFCDSSSELEAANGCPVLLESRNHQPRGERAQPSIPIRPQRALQRA